MHHTRKKLAEILDLIPAGAWKPMWVTEFPLVMWDEDDQRWYSTHHPFTAPIDEHLDRIESDTGNLKSKAYDLVLNGTEMGGGSIRIHQLDVQRRVFNVLGISDQEAHAKFEHLMEALRFGAPPHGGIALGLDRWVMLLAGQQSLRDVVAFPKTQRAVCQLTGAPAEVADAQLAELGIDINPSVKAKLQAENE